MIVRPAQPLDAGRVGAILTQSVRDQTFLPQLHSEAENIQFFGRMIDHGMVWVADDGIVRGFLAREGAYIHGLYVARGARGHGIGAGLMARAKADVDRLELYTFVANTGARRFYTRQGFVEIDRTDGSGNDEGLPDIYMVWEAKADGRG